MGTDISNMWFLMLFLPLCVITFRALMAVDYSKIFYKGRVWEIRFLFLIVSIGLAYLFASAFIKIIEVIQNLIQ